jgi:hypothetical protein
MASWGQSEHRHPRLARAHGEELDGAFPARRTVYQILPGKSHRDGRGAPCTRLVRVYAGRNPKMGPAGHPGRWQEAAGHLRTASVGACGRDVGVGALRVMCHIANVQGMHDGADNSSSYQLIHLLTHHATMVAVLLSSSPWIFSGHHGALEGTT